MTCTHYHCVAVLISLCLLFCNVPVLARDTPPSVLSPAEQLDLIQPESPTDAFAPSRQVELVSFTPSPLVARMMGEVQQTDVYTYAASLSGETLVMAGGSPYTITTRHTHSGTPIDNATLYAYERFQAAGLNVSFHDYTRCGFTNRNVVGVLPGVTRPNEIVLITAHLDDLPPSGRAPGADDNASGSTGVLIAAEIMSWYRFERTIRFVLFTGEEQGMCGSAAYAADAKAQGEDIRAVVNLDMIAYNSDSAPIIDLHARSNVTGSVEIADAFSQTVGAYGLNLAPDILVDNNLGNYSDNRSFWDRGYAAIMAIEDEDDFTPHYHQVSDLVTTLDMAYFTDFVKAALGTTAHLAYPVFNAPDLLPASASGQGAPGTLVTYTLQVSNTNPVTDTFNVSTLGNAWPATPTAPVGPVAAHTSAPLTVTVFVPSNAQRGSSDVVTVTVTCQGDSTKLDTAVLTTMASYEISPPDVTPATAAQRGSAGRTITYTLQVTNTSVGLDTFNVSVGDNAWPVTPTTPVGPLVAYASAPVTTTVTIPSAASGGASNVVTVTVASQSDPVKLGTAILTTTTFYGVYLPVVVNSP